MTLTITGGRFKGHKLSAPALIRPTAEKIRKALFDICQSTISDAFFLDLYAGSGLIGLEAISRGAKHVTFVERFPRVAKYLIDNIKLLGVQDQTTVLIKPAIDYIKSLSKNVLTTPFDLVYIDPPYGETKDLKQSEADLTRILNLIDNHTILSSEGRIFVEFSKYSKIVFEQLPLKSLSYFKKRDYGTTIIHEFCLRIPS